VVDKVKKLETIFDRIALVEIRFEVLKRDAELALLKQQNKALKQNQLIATSAKPLIIISAPLFLCSMPLSRTS
jgi:hypothetical protein